MITRRQFLAACAVAPLAPRPRLVAFGDSITVGVGASSPERAYAAIVARHLGRTLDNRAIGATTLAQQLERAIRPAALVPSDCVLFLTGYNDMRAGTPLDEYRRL